MAWYVYKGINRTQREIYYGVSKDPQERVNGSHCVGWTKAVRHWDCESDDIVWRVLHQFTTQAAASSKAHSYERQSARGWTVIQTAGI